MTEEQWRPVAGWEGLYSVSNLGRLRREARPMGYGNRMLKQLVIKCSRDRGGYVWMWLNGPRGRREFALIHRLIGAAFIGDVSGKQMNHRDGRRDNNAVDNLEIVTAKENCFHRHHVLGSGIGDTNSRSKLAEANVVPLRRLHELGVSSGVMASAFGVSEETIAGALSGRCWGHVKETV